MPFRSLDDLCDFIQQHDYGLTPFVELKAEYLCGDGSVDQSWVGRDLDELLVDLLTEVEQGLDDDDDARRRVAIVRDRIKQNGCGEAAIGKRVVSVEQVGDELLRRLRDARSD